jgi:diguanylate cyclase (GGDEF)-like protein
MLFVVVLSSLLVASRMPHGRFLSPEAVPFAQIGIFAAVAVLLTASASRRGMAIGSRLAYVDELTRLGNRRFFMEHLGDVLTHYTGKSRMPALLMLDLDRFKVVNDTLGHPAGDELLKCIAVRLESAIPADAVLARLGGDEFAVLARVGDQREAMMLSDDILSALNRPVTILGHEIWPNASIGVALPGPVKLPPTELMSMADVALYQAKSRGRGRSFIFQTHSRLPSVNRLSMESELHMAVKEKQFIMVYQPVVSLHDSHIVGAEALLRWNHPTMGMMTPDAFLALAEEAGLSQTLGHWIIGEVSRQAEEWHELFDEEMGVSINLSASEFQTLDFIPGLTQIMRTTGPQSRVVNFEISEATLLSNVEMSGHNLAELQKLGFKVAIDDFGVGYSSLSYLQNHKMDTLKLDQCFVSGDDNSLRTAEIVRSIVELAHTLGMKVIAEGIETEDQYQRVLAAGCDEGQGYYFARPMPPEELTEMLADGQTSLPLNRPAQGGSRKPDRKRNTGKPPWQTGFAERWGA